MRIASSRRVTPNAVVSPVSTGCCERGLHEGLGGQVVDLVRSMGAQHLDHRDLVEQVTGHELDAVLQMADALEVHGARCAAPCR